MAMPANACPALQHHAAHWLIPLSVSPNSEEPKKNPCIQSVTALPPKFNHLFIGSLPTFPENFIQIHLEVFVQSC